MNQGGRAVMGEGSSSKVAYMDIIQSTPSESSNIKPGQKILADMSTIIPSIGDIIPNNSRVCSMGGSIDSPYHFYVSAYQYWNEREEFMKKMQFIYRAVLSGIHDVNAKSTFPTASSLIPGLYVVAYYQREWHRARVLKVDTNGLYTVRFIDFGDTREMKIQDIRFLLESFTKFPAQAIPCSLLVKNNRNEIVVTNDWTPQQTERFLSLIYERGLAVNFTNSEIIQGEKVWKVQLDILEPRYNVNIGRIEMAHDDLEANIVALSRQRTRTMVANFSYRGKK